MDLNYSPLALFSLSGLPVAIYILAVLVYRLVFHPLARYPGPFLAKVTSLYGAYHAWIGDLHHDMWACHQRYGELVRYAPHRLLVDSAEGLHDIYGQGKNVQKSQSYDAFVAAGGIRNMFTTVDKTAHARKRRIVSYAFSEAALRASEGHILERVQVFCDQLGSQSTSGDSLEKNQWSSVKNVAMWANYLTFDIIAALAFGSAFHMLESDKYRDVVGFIEANLRKNGLGFQMSNLTKNGRDAWLLPSAAGNILKLRQFAQDTLMESMKTKRETKDILTFLREAKDPETGKGFPTMELTSESVLFLVAGSDTSSTVIAATMYYLSRDRAIYDRVLAEVRNTFSSMDEICSGLQLSSCTYLRACIDEALRMTPPVGGALWRMVLPGGAMVAGLPLPAEVEAGVPIYAIHHNPKYFPEPFTYNPDRWLPSGSNDAALAMAKTAFNPFSVGPRQCIGKNLAYMEISLSLARVAWLYDFEAVPGKADNSRVRNYGGETSGEYATKDQFTSQKHGPMLRFKRNV